MSILSQNIKDKKQLFKIGSCIEIDILFNNLLNDVEKLSNMISDFSILDDDFPISSFDEGFCALTSSIGFCQEMFFKFVDCEDNYCNYLLRYNS